MRRWSGGLRWSKAVGSWCGMRQCLLVLLLACAFLLGALVDVSQARRGYQGCCSWHGGITGQCVNGRMLCRDGTLSPSCTCPDGGDGAYGGYGGHGQGDGGYGYAPRPRQTYRNDFRFRDWEVTLQADANNWPQVSTDAGSPANGHLAIRFSPQTSAGQSAYVNLAGKSVGLNVRLDVQLDAGQAFGQGYPSRVLWSVDGGPEYPCEATVLGQTDSRTSFLLVIPDFSRFVSACMDGRTICFFMDSPTGGHRQYLSLMGFTAALKSACSYFVSSGRY